MACERTLHSVLRVYDDAYHYYYYISYAATRQKSPFYGARAKIRSSAKMRDKTDSVTKTGK
jgi:hypothetical protein